MSDDIEERDMQGQQSPDEVGNGQTGTRGHTPDIVGRAADFITEHCGRSWRWEASELAQALADAGLLCSDADDDQAATGIEQDAPLGPAPCGCPRFIMLRVQRGCAEHSDRTDLSW